jgi:transcriptional regulator with XRE-family HTH domain
MTAGRYTDESEEAYFQKIGARIKYFRKLRNYSDYERFAYEHNFHRSQYGQYEKGRNLNLATLRKILIALKVSQKEFFEVFDEIKE